MKPSAHAERMKWILVVAVLVVSAGLVLTTRKKAQQREQPPAEEATAQAQSPTTGSGPTLSTAATEESPAKVLDATEPAAAQAGGEDSDEGTGPAPGDAPAVQPTRAAEEEENAGLPTFKPLPGGLFVPIKPLTKEESDAAARKTRETLEAAKPLRTTWNDVPLQGVLRQLSRETGLILALGPRALTRGTNIRVSDPLGNADPAVVPTVWSILVALAGQHDLVLGPWKRGVLLCQPEDPEEVRLRYYDVRDLLRAEVGGGKEIPAEDRLSAVLPSLLREAARLEQRSTIKLHGGTIIARQSNATQERIGKALDTWRADPKRLQQDYMTLLSKRHPTVSGAPPRKDSKNEAPDGEAAGNETK